MLLTLTTSLAAPAAPRPVTQPPPCPGAACQDADERAYRGRSSNTSVYVFPDDNLTGDLNFPDHTHLRGPQQTAHGSLLRLRDNFIPELIDLAQDM